MYKYACVGAGGVTCAPEHMCTLHVCFCSISHTYIVSVCVKETLPVGIFVHLVLVCLFGFFIGSSSLVAIHRIEFSK